MNQKGRKASTMMLMAYPRLAMGAMMMNVAAAQPDGEKMNEDQGNRGNFYMLMFIFFSYLTLPCAMTPSHERRTTMRASQMTKGTEDDRRETSPVREAQTKAKPISSPDLRAVNRRLNLEPSQSTPEQHLRFTPAGDCFHGRSDCSGLKTSRTRMMKRRCMNCMPLTTRAQSSSGV